MTVDGVWLIAICLVAASGVVASARIVRRDLLRAGSDDRLLRILSLNSGHEGSGEESSS